MSTGYGYGKWGGGSPNPWGGSRQKLHYYALKKMFPIQDLEGTLDDDLDIEGKYLDQVYYQVANLQDNMFPDTADSADLLADFERVLNLSGTGTDAQRQAECVTAEQALINKNSKLNPAFFIALGTTLGYTPITIDEGINECFLVARTMPPATEIPALVYDYGHAWTWTITATSVPSGEKAAWEYLIKTGAPAFSKVIFIYS